MRSLDIRPLTLTGSVSWSPSGPREVAGARADDAATWLIVGFFGRFGFFGFFNFAGFVGLGGRVVERSPDAQLFLEFSALRCLGFGNSPSVVPFAVIAAAVDPDSAVFCAEVA